ncbi:hypothetical protein [Rubritalea tangerina]|uniref:hypothetical protein n=1 Tax=Rubritalea tangerina TaxID=430798 RepID=UPI0036145438
MHAIIWRSRHGEQEHGRYDRAVDQFHGKFHPLFLHLPIGALMLVFFDGGGVIGDAREVSA